MKPIASASPLIAALVWIAALLVDPGPLSSAAVLLVGVGLLAMATLGVVGIILNGGRWAHRLSYVSLGATALIALIRDVDGWWVAGVIATGLALVSMSAPSTTSLVRKLPAATGPPTRAVVLPLILTATPFLLGLASLDDTTWATLVVALTAPLMAFWYARVLPGGLIGVRIVWPLLAMSLAAFQTLAAGVISALLGLGVAIIAWHPTVKVAFHPPREIGSTYAIPPELAPGEILDAAGLDDRGKRV